MASAMMKSLFTSSTTDQHYDAHGKEFIHETSINHKYDEKGKMESLKLWHCA